MRLRTAAAPALALAASLLAPGIFAQTGGVDQEPIAKRLVAAAGIHEGDLVGVWGGVRDFGLLEEVAIHARAAGAHPLVVLASQRMAHDMFAKVPERYDTQAPALGLKLADTFGAVISVEIDWDPTALADIPPARRVASAQAGLPVGQLMLKRGVRQVNLGNGLYPTPHNATLFGLPLPQLETMFWAAVAVEPARLQATGDGIKARLSGGRELHLTHSNGTDLKMRVEGRSAFVSDGVISPEEAKAGGAACSVWLPAGEVYLAPLPGTAEGTVVVERQVYEGKDIPGLTLTFKGGRLASMSARGGAFDALKAAYDAAGPGKDVFGGIDFGINPALKVGAGSRLQSFVPAGAITVWVGDNTWAGGANESSFGFTSFLSGTTVTVDGKPIVEKGVLRP
jgi:leucyl aminopeptidase (aminopeptidase T)